jgi:gamma-glutamyltranspeptidase/glutathione hydrolase
MRVHLNALRAGTLVVALLLGASERLVAETLVAPLGGSSSGLPVEWDGSVKALRESRYAAVGGTRGMVVSDDRIASEWGAEILRKGGNAIDAAVATGFALAVTRPHYAALGGGGFLIYCPAPAGGKGKKTAKPCSVIDYRELAPAEARRDMYVEEQKARDDLSQDGPLASAVPGVPAGLLLALEKFGTKPRKELMSRPIALARNGVPVTTYIEAAAVDRWSAFNPEAKRLFGCPTGPKKALEPCAPGAVVRQTDLAWVLEQISKQGARGFYQGEVAKRVVDSLKKGAGILTLEDFASYRPKLREPIRKSFQGMEVVTMPLPSAGGTLIAQMLGYVERADQQGLFAQGPGSVDTVHALAHMMSLAFADRAKYFGDPDHVEVPVRALLSDGYLDERWKTFRRKKAALPEDAGEVGAFLRESSETTHFSVIDRHGNAVVITTTVNDNFGSGFVPPGTGIVMNNQMDDFSIRPGVPNLFGLVGAEANAIAPGKRPLSSMSPTIVRDAEGNARILIGAAGGPRITTSVFLSLVNRLRFGMSIVDAVAASRLHQQWRPEELMLERGGFAHEVRSRLTDLGYRVSEVPTSGKVHALERFPNGRVWGAPDFRGEGAAVAE